MSINLIISERWSQVPLHSAKVTHLKTISSHVIFPRTLVLSYSLGRLIEARRSSILCFRLLQTFAAASIIRGEALITSTCMERKHIRRLLQRPCSHLSDLEGPLTSSGLHNVIYLCKYLFHKFVKNADPIDTANIRLLFGAHHITRFCYEVWHSRLVYSLGIGCCCSAGCILM